MSLIQINRNPSRRQLAIFAIVWAASLGLVGWLFPLPLGEVSLRSLLWVLAVVVPAFGLVVPGFLRMAYLASAYSAWPIGVVMSYIMLGLIYYGVVTPIGLAIRLFGHDPLQRKFEPERETYWMVREEADQPDRYFQQF